MNEWTEQKLAATSTITFIQTLLMDKAQHLRSGSPLAKKIEEAIETLEYLRRRRQKNPIYLTLEEDLILAFKKRNIKVDEILVSHKAMVYTIRVKR